MVAIARVKDDQTELIDPEGGVVALPIGTKVANPSGTVSIEPLISAETPIQEASFSEMYTTVEKAQSKLLWELYQGEIPEPKKVNQWKSVGEFIISGIPPRPPGKQTISIYGSIKEDGTLELSAELPTHSDDTTLNLLLKE